MSKMNVFAYKHDGSFHRKWYSCDILSDTKDYFILKSPTNTRVLESKGNSWNTQEPAISYFSKKRWFNIIIMFKPHEVVYYCNLATPILKELDSIKYIDYDLDVKYFTNSKKIVVLDRGEFKRNAQMYEYPQWIIDQVLKETKVLQNWIKNEIGPFSQEFRDCWYDQVIKDKNEWCDY